MTIKRITAEVLPGFVQGTKRINVRVEGDEVYGYQEEVPENHFESLFEIIWRGIGRDILAKAKSKAA